MSDAWGGPGWWMAADGKWYPPDTPAASSVGTAASAETGAGSAAGSTGDAPRTIDLREFDVRAGDSVDIRRPATDDDRAPEPVGLTTVRASAAAPDEVPHVGNGGSAAASEPVAEPEVEATTSALIEDPLEDHDDGVGDGGSFAEVDVRPADDPELHPGSSLVRFPTADPAPERSSSSAAWLLAAATMLAVAAGLLGALWMRERRSVEDLRAQLAAAEVEVDDTELLDRIEALEDDVRTAQLQRDDAIRELEELRLLVAPVPEGRISNVDVPFVPALLVESRGALIAVDSEGEYTIWAQGVGTELTDSGTISGEPLSIVGIRDQAHIATSEGVVEVISLIGGEDGRPIQSGLVDHMARDGQSFWAFSPETLRLRRYRVGTGRITNTIDLPTTVRDLEVGAGAVWALGDDDLVYRVNTADSTLSPLSAGQSVISVTAGPDSMWALSAADGSLRRLDAVSGDVLVTVPVGRDPIDAVFSGSSVWVALRSGETLIEVDTRTSAIVSRTKLPATPVALIPGETGVFVALDGDVPLVLVDSINQVSDVAEESADESAEG